MQGALNADGMGNLLSGIGGTLPNTTYSSSISLAEVTGIGARRVGIVIGVIFLAVAFFPKFTAVVIAIPAPVAAAYLTVLIGMLFVQGMKIVVQDGVDHRKAIVAGLSFWIGTGFQNGWIFPDLLGDGFLAVLLGNGMTSGAMVAVLMMLLLELTGPRRERLRVPLDMDTLPQLTEFLSSFAKRAGWNAASAERLVLVGEETLASMLSEDEEAPETEPAATLGRQRQGRGRRSRAGVRVCGRGRELGGPPSVLGGEARHSGHPRNLLPLAASLRVLGSSPKVPRRGHSHGTGGRVALI